MASSLGVLSGWILKTEPEPSSNSITCRKGRKKLWGNYSFIFFLAATTLLGFYSWPDCSDEFHFFLFFFFFTIENDCWDVALSNILSWRRHPEEVHKALWGSHATKLPCKIPMPSVILPEVCDLQLPGCVCNGVWTAALGAHWECWRWRHCWHGKLPLATEAEL